MLAQIPRQFESVFARQAKIQKHEVDGFRPQGDRTQVTWTSYGPMTFLSKAMCLIMNMEKVLGPDMEKGLVQMKAVAEGRRT